MKFSRRFSRFSNFRIASNCKVISIVAFRLGASDSPFIGPCFYSHMENASGADWQIIPYFVSLNYIYHYGKPSKFYPSRGSSLLRWIIYKKHQERYLSNVYRDLFQPEQAHELGAKRKNAISLAHQFPSAGHMPSIPPICKPKPGAQGCDGFRCRS